MASARSIPRISAEGSRFARFGIWVSETITTRKEITSEKLLWQGFQGNRDPDTDFPPSCHQLNRYPGRLSPLDRIKCPGKRRSGKQPWDFSGFLPDRVHAGSSWVFHENTADRETSMGRSRNWKKGIPPYGKIPRLSPPAGEGSVPQK